MNYVDRVFSVTGPGFRRGNVLSLYGLRGPHSSCPQPLPTSRGHTDTSSSAPYVFGSLIKLMSHRRKQRHRRVVSYLTSLHSCPTLRPPSIPVAPLFTDADTDLPPNYPPLLSRPAAGRILLDHLRHCSPHTLTSSVLLRVGLKKDPAD